MTPEERHGIAEFVHKYVVLMADFSVLYQLLNVAQKRRKPPVDWQKEWGEMRKSKEYKAALKFFEPLISEVEQAKSETALIGLMHRISATKKPN